MCMDTCLKFKGEVCVSNVAQLVDHCAGVQIVEGLRPVLGQLFLKGLLQVYLSLYSFALVLLEFEPL